MNNVVNEGCWAE